MRRITLHVAIVTLALTLGLAGTAGADYTWYSCGGHEYAVMIGHYWTTVESEAVNLGGHLVTVNDAAEQTWLQNKFGTSGSCSWIGFARDGENWVWSSGEVVTFTNWAAGYPTGESLRDYAYMLPQTGEEWDGQWVNSAYYWGYQGIIERPVPLPSALILLGSGLAGLAAWRRRRG